MLAQTRRFLEMIRFSHTLFALPFAFFSAVLAWHSKHSFQWVELIGILLCMVFGRSTAMAFNRIADRDVDAANPRTAGRHLPSGQLSLTAVWIFTFACALGFLASTSLFLLADPPNRWPIILAVPVLVFICAYSLTKRFTVLAHFWLGSSLMLAPIAAWIAIRGTEDLAAPALLGLAVLTWVSGFDIIYACQDAKFDRTAGLHSVPAHLGVAPALRVALVCHVVTVALLLGLYFIANPPLGLIYLISLALVAALLAYEHAIVKPGDLARVNQAFFQVNAVISVGLFLALLAEIVWQSWSG